MQYACMYGACNILLSSKCHVGIIDLLISVSLFIAIVFLLAFFWAAKSGQFDDEYGPSVRILFDDEKVNNENINDGSRKV